MTRMALGLSALVLVLAASAFAAEESMPASQPETRAEAQVRAGRLFDKLDLNHDGKLDQADRTQRTNAMFDRIDTNHDGSISRDEFAAAHERDHGQGGPAHDSEPGHHGADRMGHWGYDHHEMGGLVMMVMHRADPGHTGTITRDAFVAAALSLFDQADTNHDGILTPDERRAAAAAMRAGMEQRRAQHQDGDGAMLPPPAGTLPTGN